MYLIHTLYIHTYMHMTYITYRHIQALGLEVIVGKMDSSPDLASKQYCGVLVQYPDTNGKAHTYSHTHTYILTCIHIYIHTYIRTHIRTHIRTYIIITGCEKD